MEERNRVAYAVRLAWFCDDLLLLHARTEYLPEQGTCVCVSSTLTRLTLLSFRGDPYWLIGQELSSMERKLRDFVGAPLELIGTVDGFTAINGGL